MELSIQKYCTVTPLNVKINGEKIVDIEAQESLEKSLIQTYRNLGIDYLKFFKMDNLSKLATLAAEILLKDTELYAITDKKDVAVILSNASSSLVTDNNYQQTITNAENYFPSPSLFVYTLPNITIGEICIKHKIYGENVFLINQNFDASYLQIYVNELFEKTNTQYCITGWMECNETTYEAFLFLVNNKASETFFTVNSLEKLYHTK